MLVDCFQEFDRHFLQACKGEAAFSGSDIRHIGELVQKIAGLDAKAERLLQNFNHNGHSLQDLIILHSYLMYQWIHPLLGKPGPWQHFNFKTGDGNPEKKPPARHLTLIAENIRSAHNVGSLFRLADCAGIERLILTGYTRTPANSSDLEKTAMGTEKTVPWTWFPDSRLAVQSLKEEGFCCLGLETLDGATDITQSHALFSNQNKIAVLLGNEHWGIAPTTLAFLDAFISIPTAGYKNSLNVIQAASLAAYSLNFGIFCRS